MKKIRIAIDGTVGSGKTVTAIRLAQKLGYKPVETGAIFRAIVFYILREKINFEDKENLKKVLEKIYIKQEFKNGQIKTFLNGEDITDKLREKEVEEKVSLISKIKEVREKVYEIEKELAKDGGIVMEGRDIGTVVLPDAEVKIFLDADKSVRAKRRGKGIEEIEARDKEDKEREIAPLKIADDAIYIDTTNLTIEEQVNKIYEIVLNKIKNET
ncbi:MAG: (d)CMP kinase [candidate division WOR-3 bacterium]|uniref:Cytidylate kinase n=1 Tax=candidate division WOR-3 bacterium TaxID=2052148 RepID=A0A7V3ZSM0_UNCW3